ncbi:PLPP6 [Acanthosepion pharaonis]|uniref:PLPP6 n=1 Tax=Acanthosepion pharaonis TaxID=158019 RepID=A0A812CUJ0_ACAPH|nr:PLPP6 [Sepia pharaonis]
MSTSTRKRNTTNVVDNNDTPGNKSVDDKETELKSDQMNNTSENDSDKIKTKDVSCSSSSCWDQLALCARSDSPLAVLRPLMIAMEISCHGLMWIIGSLTTLLCTHKIHHAQIVFNLLFGLIMDLIIVGLLKSVVRRQRPILNDMDMIATVPMDQYSFPSGHATSMKIF